MSLEQNYGRTPGLAAAIKACGGVQKLADKVGVHQTTISNWGARGNVPAEQVIKVEMATRRKVTRYELRPDLYPLERKRSKKHTTQ